MKNFLFLPCLISFFILVFATNWRVSASSIGISPAQLTIDTLLPGSKTSREITISRSDVSIDETFTIIADNVAGSSWLSFTPRNEIKIPKGQNRGVITVDITVPEGVDYKKYTPTIHIVQKKNGNASGVSIQSGLVVNLNLVVTNKQIENLKVISAKITESYVGAMLKLLVVFQNAGNVATAPSKIQLVISSAGGAIVDRLENSNIEAISPLSTENRVFEFNTKTLQLGEYFAKLKIFDSKGEEIYSYDLFFRITSNVPSKSGSVLESLGSLPAFILIIDIGLLVLIIVLFIFFKRKHNLAKQAK